MRRSLLAAAGAVAALLTSVAVAPSAGAAPSTTGVENRNVPVCAAPAAGFARCEAIRRDTVDRNGKPTPQPTTPQGYGPAELRSAYGLPAVVRTPTTENYGNTTYSDATDTIAIIDAYDAPSAERDLNVYRQQFGLGGCSTANGCFVKIAQDGSAAYPRSNGGWAQEISLDLDMASAVCPQCRLLLVEANSASFADLATAVRTAANYSGVVAISNSYGGTDMADADLESAYEWPGIAVTASTGDNGYGVSAPASFDNVIAVGGTSLKGSTTKGWTESAWSGAGSGCSTAHLNAYQDQTKTQCPNGKALADISAVADPNTGVAVYDSYAYQGRSGWMVFGGTSASAPIIAGFYALGDAATGKGGTLDLGSTLWSATTGLVNVSGGSNGTCSTRVWCNSGDGWDGPTGLGSPRGTPAFSTTSPAA